MKVAVISAVPTLGKTCLTELLGGVYSRSQGRDTVIFSTGNAHDLVEMVTVADHNEQLDNPYIVKAMIDNADDDAKELLNYGTRAGDERVFIYDFMKMAMEEGERIDFLVTAIDRVPADLTLIEICGDITSDVNTRVLQECDCSLILVDTSRKSNRALIDLFDTLPSGKCKDNIAIIIGKADNTIVSDKKFAEAIGLKSQQILRVPYNPVVGRMAYNGMLDKICYEIIFGKFEVSNLRRPMQDIMEFIFDTDKRKVVRSMDRWYK